MNGISEIKMKTFILTIILTLSPPPPFTSFCTKSYIHILNVDLYIYILYKLIYMDEYFNQKAIHEISYKIQLCTANMLQSTTTHTCITV